MSANNPVNKSTNKTLLRIAAAAVLLLLVCGVFVGAAAGETVTVSLNKMSGTGGQDSITVTVGDKWRSYTVTVPSRSGYTFDGYYTASVGGESRILASGQGTGGFSPPKVKSTETVLYAHWTANTYTVSFDKQSGSGGSSSVTATYGSSMPSATMPTRTGYTFKGYYSSTGGGGTQYYTSTGGSARSWNIASNTNLYAYWTANTYTITLNRESGSGGSSSVTATYGSSMPSATMPTRSGYNFGGYYTSTGGGGTQYYTSAGASARSWNIASNTNLYAKWTPATYTIEYKDEGDNKFTGTHETGHPTTHTYNTATSLKSASRTGYTFDGWFKESDCSGTAVTSLGATEYTAAPKLYAKWTPVTYTITYNLDGGETASSNPTEYTIETDTFTLSNPTKTGYDFAGWTGTGLTEPTKSVSVARGSYENREYTATWTPQKYSITYYDKDEYPFTGTNIEALPKEHTYDTPTPLVNAERTGYTFGGWFNTSDCSGTAVTELGAQEYTADITIYADWTPITYSVRFNNTTGSGKMEDQLFIYDKEQPLTPNTFTKDGNHFTEWNTQADGTGTRYTNGQSVINLTSTPDGIVILYACWDVNTVTLELLDNKSAVFTSRSETYGKTNSTPSPIPPEIPKYTFLGWRIPGTSTTLVNSTGHLLPGVAGYTDENGTWINTNLPHEGKLQLPGIWEMEEGHRHGYQSYDIILNKVPNIKTQEVTLGDGYYVLIDALKAGGTITIEGNVDLCLNGRELTAADGKPLFKVFGGGKLTIRDCSADQTGKIIGSESASAITIERGTVTIEGGTVAAGESAAAVSVTEYGELIVSGGSVTGSSGADAVNLYGGMSSPATLTAIGGSITGFGDKSAVYVDYEGKIRVSGHPVISGGLGVTLWSGHPIEIAAPLEDSAAISVNPQYNAAEGKTFTSGWSANMPGANPKYFFTPATSGGLIAQIPDGGTEVAFLKGVDLESHTHGNLKFDQDLNAVINSTAFITDWNRQLYAGNYVLTADIDDYTLGNINVVPDAVVNICFNGHHIKFNGNIITKENAEKLFNSGAAAEFNVYDCGGRNGHSIYTLDDLKKLIENTEWRVTEFYYLEADIDCGGETLIPIAASEKFSGKFYGQNHTISNFRINEVPYNAGLFSSVSGGTIQDLTIRNFNVSGGDNDPCVGGLVGYAESASSIINCHAVMGTASGSRNVGGLVGDLQYSALTGCSAEQCYVSGSEWVGGLVGQASGTMTINECSAKQCYVVGTGSNIGGLAGLAPALTSCTAEECYALGTLAVGGLVGYGCPSTPSDCSAVRCYVSASSSDPYVGGLVGWPKDSNLPSNEYCENCIINVILHEGKVPGSGGAHPEKSVYEKTSHTTVDNSGPNGKTTLVSSVFNETIGKITLGIYGIDYGFPVITYHSHGGMKFTPLYNTSTPDILTAGNYYLTGNLTIPTKITIADGAEINICFNGYHITVTGTGAEVTRKNAEDAFIISDEEHFKAWDCTEEGGGSDHLHGTDLYDLSLNDVSGIDKAAVTLNKEGNYTLTADLQLADVITVTSSIKLCLNGYNLTAAAGKNIFSIEEGGKLYLTDCRAHAGYLVGNSSETGITVKSGSTFTISGGHIISCTEGINAASGAEMHISGRPAIESPVTLADTVTISVDGELEYGAKVTMNITETLAAGSTFATLWNSAWGSPGTCFKADAEHSGFAVLADGSDLKFVKPQGISLVAGTITNLTGERIGYEGVADKDILVEYTSLPIGARVGISKDTGTTVIETPQNCDDTTFTLYVNGMQTTMNILKWNVTEGHTVGTDFAWTQTPGKEHINETALSIEFTFKGTAKYIPMPEITYGKTSFTLDAGNVNVTDENGNTVDHTISSDGKEIILTSPDAEQTYTYSYEGHKLGDINGDGIVNMQDTSLMTIALNDVQDLTDEQIVYANIEQSAQRQAVTLKNLVTLNTWLAEHLGDL